MTAPDLSPAALREAGADLLTMDAANNDDDAWHPAVDRAVDLLRALADEREASEADSSAALLQAKMVLRRLKDAPYPSYDAINALVAAARAEGVASVTPAADEPEAALRKYPCDDCGVLRSVAEGGRIFTVCDECWDKRKHPPAAPDANDDELVADFEREATDLTIGGFTRDPKALRAARRALLARLAALRAQRDAAIAMVRESKRWVPGAVDLHARINALLATEDK